jgi:hypothetical protein
MSGFTIGSFHLTMGTLQAVLALTAGVLALLVPRALRYVVGVYLLTIAILGLLRAGNLSSVTLPFVITLVAGIVALTRPRTLHITVGVYLIAIGLIGLLRW